MGTDAAGYRSAGRYGDLESAGTRAADRQSAPRSTRTARQSGQHDLRKPANRVATKRYIELLMRWTDIAVETGKTLSQIALNWLLQRPTGVITRFWRPTKNNYRENSWRLGLEAYGEQVGGTRRSQCCHADLSLLASEQFQ